MSADPSGEGFGGDGSGREPLMIHRTSGGGKRRKGGGAGMLILVIVAVVGGAGLWAWLHYGSRLLPVQALPAGRPSVSEAQACWRERDLACAEADYTAYLKLYPNDARANATLAIVLTQDGRHREALPYYSKASALGGVGTYDFYANYATSLDATGDLDGAIKANRASLAIVPSLVDVRGSLANQLVRKGKPQEAIDLLESFDRSLEDRGQPAYFGEQIKEIKAGMAGGARAAAEQTTPAPEAAPEAAPAGAKPGEILIPLKHASGGGSSVPVLVDGVVEADFIVDSGATQVTLSAEVAKTLMQKGKLGRSDYLGDGYAILADGSRVPAQMYNLRSLSVGGREVRNVTCMVAKGRGELLLGQSFLRRFKSWSIDNRRHVLVLQD